MSGAYATVGQYEQRVGRTFTGAKAGQVAAKLADASAIIRGALPAGYTPDTEVALLVCVQMVQRALINAGGRRYRQVGSTSEGYEEKTGLYLSDEEREQLLAAWTAEQDAKPKLGTILVGDAAYPPGRIGSSRWRSERDRARDHAHGRGWC